MAVRFQKTLGQLRNTRDLRAEILSQAAQLATFPKAKGRITVTEPVISESTVQEEWDRLLPAIAQEIRARMSLAIEKSSDGHGDKSPGISSAANLVTLERPNYRYEVLRLLLGANLEDDGPQPIKGLLEKIGASQTPIREALADLRDAGVIRSFGRGIEVFAEDLSAELLSKVRASPQILRFRYERGAQLKPPAVLLERALPLLAATSQEGWMGMALSGSPVAQAHVAELDLAGMPRLDFVASVPRDAKVFDATLIRLLDDGLELEPNVLAPAPVAVTLVRAKFPIVGSPVSGFGNARCAYPMDVFLSLLDMGLREQALQYAKAVRK